MKQIASILRNVYVKLILSCLITPLTSASLCLGNEDMRKKIAALNAGWSIHSLAVGDLNYDRRPDVAAILNKYEKKGDNETSTAKLEVYFSEPGGKLTLKTSAANAVCSQCGGMKGDEIPYSIAIKKGLILLSYFGGSRNVYSSQTKWRFQKDDFYLIGVVTSSTDTLADVGMVRSSTTDVNVSTLTAIKTVETVTSVTQKNGAVTKSQSSKCKISNAFQKMILSRHSSQDFEAPSCI